MMSSSEPGEFSTGTEEKAIWISDAFGIHPLIFDWREIGPEVEKWGLTPIFTPELGNFGRFEGAVAAYCGITRWEYSFSRKDLEQYPGGLFRGELEFDEAQRRGIPIIIFDLENFQPNMLSQEGLGIYVVEPDSEGLTGPEQLMRYRKKINQAAKSSVKYFRVYRVGPTPREIAVAIKQALSELVDYLAAQERAGDSPSAASTQSEAAIEAVTPESVSPQPPQPAPNSAPDPATPQPKPLVFISASLQDRPWAERLIAQLQPYAGELAWWDGAGAEPTSNWQQPLQVASVVVLLISSTYVSRVALQSAVEQMRDLEAKVQAGEVRIVSVMVGACEWQNLPVAQYLWMWNNGQALAALPDPDSELKKIAQAIADLVTDREATNGQPVFTPLPRADEQTSSAAAPPADQAKAGNEVSQFQFSDTAETVLRRALALSQESKRTGLTSSCLLFAFAESNLNRTDLFARTKLNRTGKYDEERLDFMTNPEVEIHQRALDAGGWIGPVSRGMMAILENAAGIAHEVSGSSVIHQRHLFAALLVTHIKSYVPQAHARLKKMGVSMEDLQQSFLLFVRSLNAADDQEAWDRVLAVKEPSGNKASEDDSGAKAQQTPGQDGNSESRLSPPPPPPDAYLRGTAGYTRDWCGVDGRQQLPDLLGVEGVAFRLAELIALRETRLPLAIGLFGNWGSGKSHFMNLIDGRLRDLVPPSADDGASAIPENADLATLEAALSANQGQWCRQIVPVYFNAWHYLDTNLWASLVTQIFESLFERLQPQKRVLQRVKDELAKAAGATAQAAEEAKLAALATQQAQLSLDAALQDSQEKADGYRGFLAGLSDLQTLSALLPQDVDLPALQKQTTRVLGVERPLSTIKDLQQAVDDSSSLAGRVRTVWNVLTAREGRGARLGLLAALVIVIGLGVMLLNALPGIRALMIRYGIDLKIQMAGAVLSGFLVWLRPIYYEARLWLGKLERLTQQVEAARKEAPETPQAQQERHKLEVAQQQEMLARQRLAKAEDLQTRLRDEVESLSPVRQLGRFIEQRAQSADYRGQLGLVSLARRDFQELSKLFDDTQALKDELQQAKLADEASRARQLQPGGQAFSAQDEQQRQETLTRLREFVRANRSIDRIVLFIDDLDRCQPDKVVEVLQAVHLLLAFPLFAVVVGVDQRCLRQSLRQQFKGLLALDEPDAADQQNNHEPKAGRKKHRIDHEERPATPLDYLEKIFHVPFHLPPMTPEGFGKMVAKLTEPAAGTAPDLVPKPPETITDPPSSQAGPTANGDNRPADTSRNGTPLQPGTGLTSISPALPRTGQGTTSPNSGAGTPASLVKQIIGSVPLYKWEREALKAYHSLIQTPRGATRLLNTYRLVRAGLPEEEWGQFIGTTTGQKDGEHLMAMFLLAAAAGYPAVARDWFERLRLAEPDGIAPLFSLSTSPPHADAEAWERLQAAYDLTLADKSHLLTTATVSRWLDRVEQFTF